jgi:hypothetical protein
MRRAPADSSEATTSPAVAVSSVAVEASSTKTPPTAKVGWCKKGCSFCSSLLFSSGGVMSLLLAYVVASAAIFAGVENSNVGAGAGAGGGSGHAGGKFFLLLLLLSPRPFLSRPLPPPSTTTRTTTMTTHLACDLFSPEFILFRSFRANDRPIIFNWRCRSKKMERSKKRK